MVDVEIIVVGTEAGASPRVSNTCSRGRIQKEEKGSMMNRNVKAAVSLVAITAMSLGTLAACGSNSSSSDGKGKVYYLNFKPEAADQWTALAKEYTKETGVEVKVQTAASGTYE